MDIPIKMPDLATIAEEVCILRWYIEVGQHVKLGQPLLEIETDKAARQSDDTQS
jgi:pyruvate/2-oxoglutarate dehydrogenase complex dihydrolipoamide acyltransferase (E2) component